MTCDGVVVERDQRQVHTKVRLRSFQDKLT